MPTNGDYAGGPLGGGELGSTSLSIGPALKRSRNFYDQGTGKRRTTFHRINVSWIQSNTRAGATRRSIQA